MYKEISAQAMESFDPRKNWQRSELPELATWDLTPIFISDEAWESAFQKLKGKLETADQYAGKLSESADQLLAALKHQETLIRESSLLSQYAHLKCDQNQAISKYNGMQARITQLFSQIMGKLAFMKPELSNIESDVIQEFMQDNAELEIYAHFFKDIERHKSHTLSEKEEILLAKAGDILDAGANVFAIFSNADLKFPFLTTKDGVDIQITQSNYISLMENRFREVRKTTFEEYYGTYKQFENTLATTLQNQIKQHNYLADVYGYKNARASALFNNAIKEKVYDQLLDTISDNLDLLHRYIRVRKKALKLDELHCYDLYVPMVSDVEFKFTPYEAQELVINALKPLGEEYVSVIRKAFDERWIDWFANEGKRSGAYSSSGAYDSNPYILLNWQGSLDSVFTLIHELGHSVHSYFSIKNQPYIYCNYSIFLAEIASTTNENLLTDYLLKTETDPNRKRYIINHYLDGFKATVFRQTQFAKFEHEIHQADQKGIPLTADFLNQLYSEINEEFYGPELYPDPQIANEWLRIPHFYLNYYVYQYATGFSAATSFAKQIIEQGQSAVDRYLQFLKAGDSDYPLQVLADSGLDMTTAEPIEQALQSFEHYLDLFEGIKS